MRRVRANTVAAEKQEVLHIIYHSRNTHAPYCIVICDLSGCTEILHIISETARLSKKKNCYGTFIEAFLILRKIQRDVLFTEVFK